VKSAALIHPDLLAMLAGSGHLDRLLVCDAGFPIPASVPRVDLAYRPGQAPFLDVLEVVAATIHLEHAVIAAEASHDVAVAIERIVRVDVERIAHSEVKALAAGCRGAVRTGEYTPYANVILTVGVAF
jgi:D-ribose pyranase